MYFSMLEKYKDRMGAHNDPPPNFREISDEEFAELAMFNQGVDKVEFRQINPALTDVPFPWYASIHLNWRADGSGWAISSLPKTNPYTGGTAKINPKMRYFVFQICDHEFGPDQGRAMFDHRFVCSKCGYQFGYDSSG